MDMLPDWFPKDALSQIATFAAYEREGIPIVLKNGALMYPSGWLKWVGVKKDE